jgi:hypothetical protein
MAPASEAKISDKQGHDAMSLYATQGELPRNRTGWPVRDLISLD